MALDKSALEAQLKVACSAMRSMSDGGDDFLASQFASAVAAYAAAGQISTVDVGTVGGNPYAGAGAGTMVVNAAGLQADLSGAFSKCGQNPSDGVLAADIAAAVDKAFVGAAFTVATTGTVTPPPPATPFPAADSATKVDFSGVAAAMQATIAAAFASMLDMTEGGDDKFCSEIASAVDAYVKSAQITATYSVVVVGSGAGKIA